MNRAKAICTLIWSGSLQTVGCDLSQGPHKIILWFWGGPNNMRICVKVS